MKLNTFCGHLVPLLKLPMSDFTELQRALKEQSAHFDPDNELNGAARQRAKDAGIGFDAAMFRGKAGPGGGIDLDSFRAAFFLLAVALNGPRKESAHATWMTWHLHQEGSVLSGWGEDWQPTFTVCPLTGHHLFGEALKTIIEDQALARRVKEVRASADRFGEIHYDDGNVSKFEGPSSGVWAPIRRYVGLDGMVLQAVGQLIQSEG